MFLVFAAQAVRDPIEFYARRLRSAMKGIGTSDTQLIRIIVSRSEARYAALWRHVAMSRKSIIIYKNIYYVCLQIDLADIKVRYRELHRRSLEDEVKSECTGSYRNLLLAILTEKSAF